MFKVIIETDDISYWLGIKEGKIWYQGEDIDPLIGQSFREIAFKNEAEMYWNDQTGEYEFTFYNQENAERAKEEVEKLLKGGN